MGPKLVFLAGRGSLTEREKMKEEKLKKNHSQQRRRNKPKIRKKNYQQTSSKNPVYIKNKTNQKKKK